MKRGFLLGKFMPPHAGHMLLCETALRLVDELTILVCWLPDDPIPGPLRLAWMRELLPGCKVIGHADVVPQHPSEHPGFWPIWRDIVRRAHPEPIDMVFAGEEYGSRLAAELCARFVPVGARAREGGAGIGAVSGTAIRADPWTNWRWLPPPVRRHYAVSICLHGPESVGKSVVAQRLATHYDTVWVPEYGRAYCEENGTTLDEAGLVHIGRTQQAMIEASLPWCNRRLFTDTDALMTAAWSRMMLGSAPEELSGFPKCGLYLMLEPDTAWVDDGTRLYGDDADRAQFASICRDVLEAAGVRWVAISGSWDQRFDAAVAAIETLGPASGA